MVIYGASGHAKVIIDIVRSNNEKTIDFIFDDNHSIKELLGIKVRHNWTNEMRKRPSVIAIGNNIIRRNITEKFENAFCEALVHKSAVLSTNIFIGDGSVIMPNAVINSSAKIGVHCILNTGSIVEHDVVINDFVHISPGVTVTGNVQIGEGTQIGAGATIIPGIKIGKWATIGAGAVIINDVPDFSVVVGNPGKTIKFNKLENE
ncbi:acetyltransferase [Christiangramia forsetii]|uniref:Transferase n=2 Tax=Christiangramia forsetii TaxID=411153 RepID=A0M2V7_CHRFK|nr:acetyltransferase [Christiangramia forsetii]GGG44711.1 acetyltransferase [Christiangramia forsetii]CAL66952.1 transferase [Christiangramia forsetii KT0803]